MSNPRNYKYHAFCPMNMNKEILLYDPMLHVIMIKTSPNPNVTNVNLSTQPSMVQIRNETNEKVDEKKPAPHTPDLVMIVKIHDSYRET